MECDAADGDTSKRRSSARIQKIKTEKALIARTREESSRAESMVGRKRTRFRNRGKVESPNVGSRVVENGGLEANTEISGPNERKDLAVVEGGGERMNTDSTEVAENGGVSEKSPYVMVTETLRTFNKHYLHFVQEEEKRCGKVEVDRKATKGRKSKKIVQKRDTPEDDSKRASKRPDLKALSTMLDANTILYPEKRVGSIAGIDVGHQFFSRAEMVAVGFHSHWLNGIDYIGQTASREFTGFTLPLAVGIVMSGQYEDDLDNCDDIVYTGQGGNNLLGNRRQIRDQVMLRGNLGLKNSMEQCVPVRVVRGHQCKNSYVGKVYTYDGLYKVVNYWAEKGVSGFTVFKFRLKRLEGQPFLTTNQVHYHRGRIPNSISEIRGLVCEDIADGQENIPIPATNLVDDPPIAPAVSGFTYCKYLQVSKSVKLPANGPGCNCKGSCRDPRTCACARLNGSDFPYVHRDGGRLVEPKAVVFECGPNCGCGPDCVNRTSQKGLKYRLEVFRTPKKGWAVRSWDYIPSGAPVCEYIGILTKTDDIDTVLENSFIFDIDCLQTMKGLDGRERRLRDVSIPSCLEKDDEKDSFPEFCIDAGSTGNIARFINHSCQPNLFVQCVLSTHHNIKLARVMLFAADNIPPLQELTYDYGYALDSVMGPDGKIKQMACYCGAADCRKRLF